MTINALITKATSERIACALYGKQDLSVATLYELAEALKYTASITSSVKYDGIQWQCELREVTNYSQAMLTFCEMFFRGIVPIQSSVLAYYFASKVIETEKSRQLLGDGYFWRAKMIYLNQEFFIGYFDTVGRYYYKGDSMKMEGIEIQLLADVYKAMDLQCSDKLFDEILGLVPDMEEYYSALSKEDIIKKGLESSSAYYRFIDKRLLKDSSFTSWKKYDCYF